MIILRILKKNQILLYKWAVITSITMKKQIILDQRVVYIMKLMLINKINIYAVNQMMMCANKIEEKQVNIFQVWAKLIKIKMKNKNYKYKYNLQVKMLMMTKLQQNSDLKKLSIKTILI